MAAVNFYKFASAVMELLKPENEQEQLESIMPKAEIIMAIPKADDLNETNTAAKQMSAALSAKPGLFADSSNISQIKVDVKTVEAVAAHLTEALENASQDKINTVAKALEAAASQAQTEQKTLPATVEINSQKQVLIETLAVVKESFSITEHENAGQPNKQSVCDSSSQAAATLAQSAVETIAKQTVKEVESNLCVETVSTTDTKAITSPASKISAEEVKATVENAIKKQDASTNNSETSVSNVEKGSVKEVSSPPSDSTINDFWETYQEADPTNIKYEGLMQYAYRYMIRNSLLDSLNPEIQISSRRDTIFEAFGNADNELISENSRYFNFERDTKNSLNNLRETGDNSIEESKKEQTELEYRQNIERHYLEQKLAELNAERSKRTSQ